MLYNRTAILQVRTIDTQTRVKSYTWTTEIVCNVQPVNDNQWLLGADVYSMYKLYTPYMLLKEWDKLTIDWEVYIVNGVQDYNGLCDKYLRCMIDKSKWN